MAQVHLDNNSNKKWIVVAGAVAAAVAAGVWFTRSHEAGDDSGRVTSAASAPMSPATPAASSAGLAVLQSSSEPMTATQIEAETKSLVAKQQEAVKALEKSPSMKPIKGPVRERPEFVSELEWQMLKGVTQQAGDPDKEMTRLVNFLRFNKQLELLESMHNSPDKAKRKEIADQLLEELPTRITNSEMDMKEAQRIMNELLNDAELEPQARAKRASAETARLNKAVAALPAKDTAKDAAK